MDERIRKLIEQEQHRQVGVAAQRAADVEAGDVGQADVEDDEIDAALLQPRQRLAAQRAALGGKALGAQRVAQRIGDGRFVVDDQDLHDGGNDKPCGRNGSRVVRTSARQWLVAKCSSDFNRWAFLRGKHAVP